MNIPSDCGMISCRGTPGKPGMLRKMTWTEDPPVCVGYCDGCQDCDPDGSHRRVVRERELDEEQKSLTAQIDVLERRLTAVRAEKAAVRASPGYFKSKRKNS